MKKTLLFLSVFLSVSLFGQDVYIPDANFKAYLVGNSAINTNGDTEIQVSEATAYDGVFDFPPGQITDMTGIEAFTALTALWCVSNELTSLDISQNNALTFLNCAGNQLSSLDVSQNTALTYLNCSTNPLTSLDVSQNTALTTLSCGATQFTSLDVSQNSALEILECWNSQLTSLNTNGANALIELQCTDNYLTSLDVSQNTALYSLKCFGNQLSSLDISQNNALSYLDCNYNQLTSLDVTQNTSLTDLRCSNNQLTSLDVSQNIALTMLNCMSNQLYCLNVANGNNIYFPSFPIAGPMTSGNPNLTCIEVDDAEWSTSNWTSADSQTSFSEDCNYPENCDDSSVGLTELTSSKNLIQILDLMGRETSFKPNTPLIYVYDDGSTEKVFTIE
ncbi:leucine-rich repeat domain-containing protein [Crocinitomicaceae bacterium]|nr:leucine-rich repeat domain-containing protein [Crocinitomicaceae bacterium]